VKKVITFFVRYPVWTSLVFFSVLAFGMLSLGQLRYSFFPEIVPDVIFVQVAYPGAAPDEVAEGVVLKIEEALDGLDGVDRVTSVSRENFGTVSVEITRGFDVDRAVADVKNAVDRVSSFPLGAEKPIIFQTGFRTRSLSVVLFGDADLVNLKYIAEAFRDDLLATDEISKVDFEGLPNLEISISVSEADLRRYNISFDEIAGAVKEANINVSGGKFETRDEEILIRAWGRDYYANELRDIPVRGSSSGTVVMLGDFASITERWEDTPDKRYYNGRTAIILTLDQTEQEDILAIAEVTKAKVAEFNENNSRITAEVLGDRTIPLRQRVNLLVRNGMIGLLLVVVTLGFFLKLRLSFWVAVSIPFSFAGMFILAGFQDITINVISLFGMILVVGILVDDAIVVSENIYSLHEKGVPRYEAAIMGTKQMLAPVTTSVLTTVIAFLPFFFLDGRLGKFIWQMAFVVVFSLLFSLVEAFLILPSHLAPSKVLLPGQKSTPVRKRIDAIIHHLTHRIYAPVLRRALKNKWVTVATPIAFVLLTVGLVGGGIIGMTFFPFIDRDSVPVNISLVAGRQESDTDSILAAIEEACWVVNDEFKSKRADGLDVIEGIKREIGDNDFGETGSHAGRLTLLLLDGEQRDLNSYVIANRIRELVGPVPEAKNIAFGLVSQFGKPVSVSLLGNDYTQLDRARNLLLEEFNQMPELKDITDSDQEGRREVNLILKPRAYVLGLTLQDVAGQVRQGFFGQEIQRIQRGRDEIRVWVRYREADRSELGFLDRMRIRTPDGSEYPFSELAHYDIERGVTAINHLSRRREIQVEANLSNVEADLPPILTNIRENVIPRVLSQVNGVTVSYEGQSRDQAKFAASMSKVYPLALIGMFVLVTFVFRSYAQALMVFSLIPIGVLGAIWGHGIQGIQLNTLSIYGILALSGIIINDSIVLVDQVNRNLRDGQRVYDAVYNAGISRLRPILLTTFTTALGLAPLIFEKSRQAQFLIPMAVSVAYGLIFGTLILLLILPALFLVFSSLRVRFARLFLSKPDASAEAVEPAIKELEMPAID